MNGWIYQYNEKKGFSVQQVYQHENTGWYGFWGKAQNGQPVLYHYDYERGLMRQSTIEDGVWVTNTIYNTSPQGAIELYNSQINHVDYHTQANQFGFEYKVHRDGFYDFLELKHDWEQSLLKKEKGPCRSKRKEKSDFVQQSGKTRADENDSQPTVFGEGEMLRGLCGRSGKGVRESRSHR